MKADPAASTLLDVGLEGGRRRGRPAVGRIVQLEEEAIPGEEASSIESVLET